VRLGQLDMRQRQLDIVILGLSVTSSWGNGHATTYRGLIRGLAARGHRILFLERDVPWYAENRDQPSMPEARIELYHDIAELTERFEAQVSRADLVIVGSFVPDGIRVGEWVTSAAHGVIAFYDIDTPVTLGQLESGTCDYLSRELVAGYHLYLSFTGGPTLTRLERNYGSPMARVLYCAVDPEHYYPERREPRWDLGYLGTYSADRQPALERLLLEPARRLPAGSFAVAGPMYPETMVWPANVERTIHLAPKQHRRFYAAQRFTLNITRAGMVAAGYSPSVRLFEAGACGVPIISDRWDGIETLFRPGCEILLADSEEDVLRYLFDISEEQRAAIGERARACILAAHTPGCRAAQLERYYQEAYDHFLAHSPRRNGRGRQVDHGLAARIPSQRKRQGAGEAAGRKVEHGAARSGLQQPARKGLGNGGRGGAAAPAGGPAQ
jgi:spore maturation protein CgeB